jgi:hypothetical protein
VQVSAFTTCARKKGGASANLLNSGIAFKVKGPNRPGAPVRAT